MPRSRTWLVAATSAVILAGTAVASAKSAGNGAPPATPGSCSHALAAGDGMTAEQHRACVIAVASTLLDAEAGQLSPTAMLLDPAVSVHAITDTPVHNPGNAAAVRARIRTIDGTRVTTIADRQWTVDGDAAMVAYDGRQDGSAKAAFARAELFTIRNGVIWEVTQTPVAQGPPGAGTPTTPVVAVAGPPATASTTPNYDDASWCSDQIAEHGDASLTAAQHRRCMIAIASTYVNAEENSTPGNQILFDPRVSRYSLGGAPNHSPSNSDLIRTQEGTYQSTYNRVIRQITDRQWVVDGNQAWILYHGYLVISTTHPGFYVAERFTITRGLIWEIMIAPVATKIP